ncbi:hypothetical protein Y1Q_0004938 [Alligator mississippiensis]|uniref:Uncharacterized protein n=1 Tax=Alligator mississippiensis TaxID=8496 RepID=A0A151MYB2_ALLMI|nr:hypothetical protein Y1Q_0004938 [Alligator mississippiensis]
MTTTNLSVNSQMHYPSTPQTWKGQSKILGAAPEIEALELESRIQKPHDKTEYKKGGKTPSPTFAERK